MFGHAQEAFAGFSVDESRKFDVGRSHQSAGRGIAHRFRNVGRIVIPVGNLVGGQVRMIHQIFADAHRMIEVAAFARLTIHHRVAVETPRLTACPRRRIGIALPSHMMDGLACFFVVAYDVIRTGIGPEVVVHRHIGVRFGHVAIAVVARQVRSHGQQFEVHHVVDNDRVTPFLGVPRAGAAHLGVESCGEVARCGKDDVAVGFLVRQPVAVAVGAVDGEADVVVVGTVFLALHALGKLFGDTAQVFAAAVFIQIPHRTRKEPAGPPAYRAHDERVVGRIPAAGHLIGRLFYRFIESERLFDGEVEGAADGAYRSLVAHRTFFGLHRRSEAGEKNEEQKFFHDCIVFTVGFLFDKGRQETLRGMKKSSVKTVKSS